MRKSVSGSPVQRSAKYDSSRPRLRANPAISRCPRPVSAAMYWSTAARRPSGLAGKRFGPCNGVSAEGLRVVRGAAPSAEVEALLLVRLAGGQLVADPEVATPRATTKGHADLEFCLQVLREELPAQVAQTTLQRLIHAVTDDVEKTALPARLAKAFGDSLLCRAPRDQVAHVNDRDVREVTRWSHEKTPTSTGQPERAAVSRMVCPAGARAGVEKGGHAESHWSCVTRLQAGRSACPPACCTMRSAPEATNTSARPTPGER